MQAKQLAQPVDVLIGTPQRLLQHAERGNLFYGCVWWSDCHGLLPPWMMFSWQSW